jgi:hypothetical protein
VSARRLRRLRRQRPACCSQVAVCANADVSSPLLTPFITKLCCCSERKKAEKAEAKRLQEEQQQRQKEEEEARK